MSQSYGGFTPADLMNPVPVRNRVQDGSVFITYDSREWEWKAGEVKHLPKLLAEWFVYKSSYAFVPGSVLARRAPKFLCSLVIDGTGKDESPLTLADVTREENIAREHMEKVIDPATGQPFRSVILDVSGVAGTGKLEQAAAQQDHEVAQRQQAGREVIAGAAAELIEEALDAPDSPFRNVPMPPTA